jgi:hypothetical protein
MRRTDGSLVHSSDVGATWQRKLISAALDLANDPPSDTLAAQLIPGRSIPPGQPATRLPEPSLHSEWSRTAILRRDWLPRSPQLTLAYGGGKLVSELNHHGTNLWSGTWDPCLSLDGQPLRFDSEWDEVCWITDSDGDYLELEMQLETGSVQRQVFFSREDFVFVADAYLGTDVADLEYTCTLPLANDMVYEAAEETHDGLLIGPKPMALVLPLAFPEWRAAPHQGEVKRTAEGLQLCQRTRGMRLFAPLFIDLDPRRIRRELTWRRLTVAEQREIVADDVAVGFRVQIGRRQWLVYRSLAPACSRTVLGQNFSTEFMLGQFSEDGEAIKLIEIES